MDACVTLGIYQLRSRRGTFAVGPVTASLQAGDCLALIGVNGAGKTTLLETLAGFFPVMSGHVWLDGEDITARAPEHRRMAYLPQDLALFPHLSAIENVAFAARRRRVREWQREVDALVAEFGLEDLRARYPHQLSRGQAQRVAFARALAARPAVLLLDEPAANLDPQGQRNFHAAVSKLLIERGSTVVFATHDILDSLSFADQLIVLDQGQVVQAGPREALFDAPASVRVAELLGISNVWPADILGTLGGVVRICTGGCELQCAAAPIPQNSSCVAIGPGEIEVLPGAPTDTTNCLKAVVRSLQVGSRTASLNLAAAPGDIQATLPPWRAADVVVGETIWIRLPADRLRLLPGPCSD
ncbi:MAG: ABC transporter ATP-binding protein [Rhodanobacteraceae bacterium]